MKKHIYIILFIIELVDCYIPFFPIYSKIKYIKQNGNFHIKKQNYPYNCKLIYKIVKNNRLHLWNIRNDVIDIITDNNTEENIYKLTLKSIFDEMYENMLDYIDFHTKFYIKLDLMNKFFYDTFLYIKIHLFNFLW